MLEISLNGSFAKEEGCVLSPCSFVVWLKQKIRRQCYRDRYHSLLYLRYRDVSSHKMSLVPIASHQDPINPLKQCLQSSDSEN